MYRIVVAASGRADANGTARRTRASPGLGAQSPACRRNGFGPDRAGSGAQAGGDGEDSTVIAALQLAALLRDRPTELGKPETALLLHWLDRLAGVERTPTWVRQASGERGTAPG